MELKNETCLNKGTEIEKLTADDLTMIVGDNEVKVLGFLAHGKATEDYAVVSVCCNGVWNEWYIPYVYRWHNICINTAIEIAERIKACKPLLTVANIEAYKINTRRLIKLLLGARADVTTPIFKKLLKNCGEWVCNREFRNPNPQRRILDLKQKGFTLATKIENKKTYHMLLPFDIVKAPTYETIPANVRKLIFAALGNKDAYYDKPVDRSALPDHKFPEIRWNASTPKANDCLNEDDMREKFQLLSESINQAKREVCRGCFQTGKRGKFYGIEFFYKGDEAWPQDVPTTGKEAEAGCVGCFWYDMAAWRKALNKLIKGKQQ